MRKRVLIIEDEADVREVLDYNLTREGFRVVSTGDGERGLQLARDEAPHVVLLDLMLPGRDGIEICRRLKGDPVTENTPVIMVTAKGEESDIVLGLGMGADDYVTKPFSPKELVARIKAVLRRGPLDAVGEGKARIVWGDLVVDIDRHEVTLDGTPVDFTPSELRLLHLLASHPGRVFTRDQLLSRVIGGGAYVIDRNIDVHIRGVRKKLGGHRELIETVRGVGYRFRTQSR